MSKAPLTVSQLIDHLKQFDPNDVVMIECDDHYYSGPLTPEKLDRGHAVLLDPFDWQMHHDGLRPRTMHYPGGWNLQDESEGRSFSERKACVVILASAG